MTTAAEQVEVKEGQNMKDEKSEKKFINARVSARVLYALTPLIQQVDDVARRTLEVFEHWYPRLCDWPVALVAQDGQENLPIPWDLIAAVFIGGSTQWKLGHHAAAIIKAAKAMGKWAHAGRVKYAGAL